MALSVPPSNFWSGIDGTWSTFVLQVGTPPTPVDVFISTSQPVEYVIAPQGCPGGNSNTTCASDRGNLFDPQNSTSWKQEGSGFYTTNIEYNLGYSDVGEYGYDTVALGYEGGDGPSLGNQIVVAIESTDFYLGSFGILPKPFNLTNYNDPYPSYLQTLKNNNKIPSLSWAYTAGAKYQLNGVFGSLTLGGYDSSKFSPNSLTIPINSNVNQYLTLGVQEINIAGASSNGGNALSSGISMMLDSTLPYIWLPRDACDVFANAFNLDYDNSSQLYTISDSVRDGLLSQSPPPSVTFVIASSASGGDTVQINLPFQAFDLTAQPPLVNKSTNYFPIKRASNSTQYVLGRTFFQEAYVIADFERNNFSVSQAQFQANQQITLNAISSPSSPTPIASQTPSSGGSNDAGAIAGGVVGGVAAIAIIALIAFFVLRHRRRRNAARQAAIPPEKGEATGVLEDGVPPYTPHHGTTPPDDLAELEAQYKERHELEARESAPGTPKNGYYATAPERAKSPTTAQERSRSPLSELETRQVHEMPASEGDRPAEQEQTAKPLHLRTVSRDEIRSPSILSSTTDAANASPPASPSHRLERPHDPTALPAAFVPSATRDFNPRDAPADSHTRDISPPGSATLGPRRESDDVVSPGGSRTMSPTLETRSTVSTDSVPIFLDKPSPDVEK